MTENLNTMAFRHQLIQGEFRSVLTQPEHEAVINTDAVVVLSGQEFMMRGDVIDPEHPENIENIARLKMGIEVVREVTADRIGKRAKDIEDDDIRSHGPELVLDGTTEQLPIMEELVSGFAFPMDKATKVDCGSVGVGNTKTQIEVAREYTAAQGSPHVTFISSAYHVPRIKRTAKAGLDDAVPFDVVHVPNSVIATTQGQVRGEVLRIIKYAEKGDITPHV
jgi:uncharacterized SAM-binding protein YcdF (DUF218 family)